jgi:hypothetical protein
MKAMARIPEPSQPGIFTRFVYWMTKRKLGRVVFPVKVTAHQPRLLWGYGQMETALLGLHSLDETLKELASIKVATLIGCPF